MSTAMEADLNQIARSDEVKGGNLANDEDLFNELENEDDVPAHIRNARLNELKQKALENQFRLQNATHSYGDLKEEEFLSVTTKTKKCIVHFYHADFRRCDIMHTHLQKLAIKYPDVRFAKINVEKAKFFVNKLQVQVLPAVLCFEDGILKCKVIGFEQLGNTDNFATRVLEKKLWKLEFLKKPDDEEDESGSENEDEKRATTKKSSIFGRSNNNDRDSDSD